MNWLSRGTLVVKGTYRTRLSIPYYYKRVLILAILWLLLNFVLVNIMRYNYTVLNLVRIVKISTLKTEEKKSESAKITTRL